MEDEDKPLNSDRDSDDASRYRRPRRPIEIRQRSRWKEVWRFAPRVLLAMAAVTLGGGAGALLYRFVASADVFELASLEAVELMNAERVAVAAVREHFAEDVGSTIFAVPLEARRNSLEEIAWVESATVQRLFPNRLRVYLHERTPVAFVRKEHSLWLVDRHGVLLPALESTSYSFPVLSGLSEAMTAEERQARVGLYLDFLADLDRDGKTYSAQISEFDLSDPDNLRASVPEDGGVVYLHFGRGRYQEKYEAYLQHRSLWKRSGETVRVVDLRFRGQIVLNPDTLESRSR